jgi:hypothetical protein
VSLAAVSSYVNFETGAYFADTSPWWRPNCVALYSTSRPALATPTLSEAKLIAIEYIEGAEVAAR